MGSPSQPVRYEQELVRLYGFGQARFKVTIDTGVDVSEKLPRGLIWMGETPEGESSRVVDLLLCIGVDLSPPPLKLDFTLTYFQVNRSVGALVSLRGDTLKTLNEFLRANLYGLALFFCA